MPLEKPEAKMVRMLVVAAALLLPGMAQAQLPGQNYPYQSYIPPNVVVTPPPFVGSGAGSGYPLPFETQQQQSQRLLEMLDTGGIERPAPAATPPGCVFAGQVYTEGATVRSEGGDRQVCGPRPGGAAGPERPRSAGVAAGAGLMRLTRGPRRRLKPEGEVVRTPEEARIWSSFRTFKAGITGEKGEASVREALDALRVPALHDVILRDRRGLTQIDHVVRAPDAVLVLETKRYAGIVSGEIDGRAWVQRFDDSAGRFTLPNPLRQNYRHRRAVEELIADRAVLVRTHVVAAGSAVFEGELAGTIVPVTALSSLLNGTPPVSQRWLDAAWRKLQMAAERSSQLREAHRQQVERRTG